MKKILMIAAVALATITTANAQEFKIGAKAGFLLSNISAAEHSATTLLGVTATEKYNTAFKPGFHFGAFVEYGFNEQWWIEAGVDYAFQGGNIKSFESLVNGTAVEKYDFKSGSKWTTQQFNIPIWFKYDINGFRPKVGVNLGFLSKAEATLKYEGTSEKLNLSFSPDKTFDFGVGLGAEYNLDFGLFFDATFNLGLTDLSTKNDETRNIPLSMTFKNRVFQIGVGYKF